MSLGKIKRIDEGVWCLESYFLSLGCRGSLRMTILKTHPEGLIEKIGSVDGAKIISPNTLFGNDSGIKTYTLTGHHIQETMIYHEPSRTLLTADLLYNYQAEQYPAEKLFFWMIGNYGRPNVAFYHKFSVKDKSSIQFMIDTITSWPINRIIMSHGSIIESADASTIFADAWQSFAK